jgi:hypothetical protein
MVHSKMPKPTGPAQVIACPPVVRSQALVSYSLRWVKKDTEIRQNISGDGYGLIKLTGDSDSPCGAGCDAPDSAFIKLWSSSEFVLLWRRWGVRDLTYNLRLTNPGPSSKRTQRITSNDKIQLKFATKQFVGGNFHCTGDH